MHTPSIYFSASSWRHGSLTLVGEASDGQEDALDVLLRLRRRPFPPRPSRGRARRSDDPRRQGRHGRSYGPWTLARWGSSEGREVGR